MRMVARAHNGAANRRPDTLVPFAAGFAQLDIAVLDVADLADSGHAIASL